MRAALPLRIALPHLEPFLAANVEKEVRKDALVIRGAARALACGALPAPAVARQILEQTKEIDRKFLGILGRVPILIEVPYERIAPIRLQRIERGMEFAYLILEAWARKRKLRDAFLRPELERRLLELLGLYAKETRALSHTVRLPAVLAPLREGLAERLHRAMDEVASELTGELLRRGKG